MPPTLQSPGLTGRHSEHSPECAGFSSWHLQSLHKVSAKPASTEMSGIAPLGGQGLKVCTRAAPLGVDWLQLTACYLPPITGLLNLLKGLWRLPFPRGVGCWRMDFGNAN